MSVPSLPAFCFSQSPSRGLKALRSFHSIVGKIVAYSRPSFHGLSGLSAMRPHTIYSSMRKISEILQTRTILPCFPISNSICVRRRAGKLLQSLPIVLLNCGALFEKCRSFLLQVRNKTRYIVSIPTLHDTRLCLILSSNNGTPHFVLH